MKSAYLLKNEIENKPDGIYAPYYWKYLGYKSNLGSSKREARVNAVKALFTLPEAYIYQNDWIVGSLRSMFCEKSKEELDYALRIEQSFGNRTFAQNSDHFAPDYRKFVKIGIPGVLQNIRDSIRNHTDADEISYLQAMEQCMLAMRDMVLKYAEKARELQGEKGYDDARLEYIRNNVLPLRIRLLPLSRRGCRLIWFCAYLLQF